MWDDVALFGDHSPAEIVGALTLSPREHGATLSRLPAWALAQITDPAVSAIAAMPVSCRVAFTTNAEAVRLRVLLTHLHFGDAPLEPKSFDLVVADEIRARATSRAGHVLHFGDRRNLTYEFQPGEPGDIEFGDLGTGEKRIEIWLPHNALVDLHALSLSKGSRVSRSVNPQPRWIHYGSSISHHTEAARPTDVWPVVVARRARVNLQSLALSGQCHLDQFVARTIRDLPVDFISVKAGANIVGGATMRERTYVPALHGFLDTIRDAHPLVPILVCSPILCPTFEDHPGPHALGADGIWRSIEQSPDLTDGALTGRRVRALVHDIVASRQKSGDPNVHFLNGVDLHGRDDADVLPDGLHPDNAGYAKMAERFYDLVFSPGAPFA